MYLFACEFRDDKECFLFFIHAPDCHQALFSALFKLKNEDAFRDWELIKIERMG